MIAAGVPSRQGLTIRAVRYSPAIAVMLCLIIAMLGPYHVWEDAMVHARYVENLTKGYGFVYNVGERVQGTSSPLFVLFSAVLVTSGLPVLTSMRVISFFSFGGVLALVWLGFPSIWRSCEHRAARAMLQVLAIGFIGLQADFLYWATSGMETTFYIFLLLLSLAASLRARHKSSASLAALAVLTRSDGILLGAIVLSRSVMRSLIEKERHWMGGAACLFFPVLGWCAFAGAYFGQVLPQSLIAKTASYVSAKNVPLAFWRLVTPLVGRREEVLVAALAVAGVCLVLATTRRVAAPILGWFAVYLLGMGFSGTHIHPWYTLPLQAIWLLLAGWGAMMIAVRLPLTTTTAMLLAVAVLGFWGWRMSWIDDLFASIAQEQMCEERSRIAAGEWLASYTPAEATVYTESLGHIGYYSGRHMYDRTGLVTPAALASPMDIQRHLADLKPAYYVRDPAVEFRHEGGRLWLYEHYAPVLIYQDCRPSPVATTSREFSALLSLIDNSSPTPPYAQIIYEARPS